MGINSKIEWTEATWNPVTGCTKISPGCKNCYAERVALRLQAMGQPNYVNGFSLTTHDHMLDKPLRWKKPKMIFVNSMSDLLHKDIPSVFIEQIFDVMRRASWHTFQVLTKRPERIPDCLPEDWGNGYPNVWLGISVEHGRYLWRMDILRKIPAVLRFVSTEPLLGPLVLDLRGFDWVITGGESGPNCRSADEQWFLDVRDQCIDAGVSYFHKQGGGARGGSNKLAGRVYDDIPTHKPVEIQKELWAP